MLERLLEQRLAKPRLSSTTSSPSVPRTWRPSRPNCPSVELARGRRRVKLQAEKPGPTLTSLTFCRRL